MNMVVSVDGEDMVNSWYHMISSTDIHTYGIITQWCINSDGTGGGRTLPPPPQALGKGKTAHKSLNIGEIKDHKMKQNQYFQILTISELTLQQGENSLSDYDNKSQITPSKACRITSKEFLLKLTYTVKINLESSTKEKDNYMYVFCLSIITISNYSRVVSKHGE